MILVEVTVVPANGGRPVPVGRVEIANVGEGTYEARSVGPNSLVQGGVTLRGIAARTGVWRLTMQAVARLVGRGILG